MSLQTIAQTLYNEAVANGTITIDDALLGTGTAFAQLVQSSLLRTQGNVLLTAAAGNIPNNPSGTSFSFVATMPAVAADSFLNLNANAVTVTVSQQGTAFQVALDIQLQSGGTPNWVLSTSFFDMLGWPFDSLPLTQPGFLFLSGTGGLPQGTYQGLNFSATVGLTGMLAPVQQFLTLFGYTNPPMTALAGLISQTPNGTAFVWSSSFTSITSIDLTALTLDSLTLKALFGYTDPPAGGNVQPEGWGQIVLMAETTLSGQQDPIDVSLVFPMVGTSSIMALIIAPPPGSLSTSLGSLGKWMAGKSWDDFFSQAPASELAPYLNTFGLRSYSITFGLDSPFTVMDSTLSVGTLRPWPINPPNLSMTEFSVSWQLIDPFGAAYSTISIRGELTMFGDGNNVVTFSGSILLPDLLLSLALRSKTLMTGAQWLQTIVTAFGGGAVDPYILSALDGFSLKLILFNMNVPNEDFTYQMTGSFTVGDKQVNFNLYVHLNIKSTLEYDIKTEFVFGCVSIMGEITNNSGQTVITGAWANEANPLGLNDIAYALGYDSLGIPPDLDMGLKRIALSYTLGNAASSGLFAIAAESANYGSADLIVFKPAGANSYIFFGGVKITKPIDLTNLPLVGKALSLLETVQVQDMQVLITSAVITAPQVSALNAIISSLDEGNGELPQIPAQGMAATVNISMNFNIGGYIIPLGSGVGGLSTTPGMPADKNSVQGTASGNTSAPVPWSPGSQSDGVSWFNVQKAVGPVMFRRIGIQYKDAVLWFLLDASFSAGGLTIDLLGAGIGSPLSSFEPSFTISGLGIDFEEPGFEVGAAFMKIPPGPGVDWEFAGGAVIKAASFSISAVGSYASLSGTPSMFIFGQVTGTFGGPPPFFVTGFAGGFGYNSNLRLPAVNEIYEFPLVAGAQNPSVIGGNSPDPATVLAILLSNNGGTPWVTHQVGQYWFAAGIQFTTYSLVSSNALLVVAFGKTLQFALLGLSRARFPMSGPVTYAFLELQLAVLVDPNIGLFALSAILSPNSFVLDPACKLTGGFAFYYWFEPNNHAGDFVITVGGYHPAFDRPQWYPEVPRVGFSWSLDSSISIQGGAYFAMTPSAAMTGGRLSATYQNGKLKAWFTAWADTLIYWNPFRFDIYIGVSVGASYTLDLLFTTKTLEVELGATLHLWGPPTGGSATVHWWVISFTVDFGQPPAGKRETFDWTNFLAQLPPPASIVKIVPGDGLAPNGQTDLNSGTPWVARPAGFSFITSSAIPSSSLLLGSAGTPVFTGDAIDIRPMQATGLVSNQQLVIKRNGAEFNPQTEGWVIDKQQQNVAKAMWGKGPQDQVDAGTEQLVKNQLMGFKMEAPSPSQGTSPGPIDVAQNLAFDPLQPVGQLPIQPNGPAQGAIAQVSNQTIYLIETQIADPTYATVRTNLFDALAALGIALPADSNSDMEAYSSYADALFGFEPLLIPES